MPVSWDEEAQWADDAVRKANELGCSIAEAEAVVGALVGFVGSPARITRLAAFYLDHLSALSEELERDKKASEKN